MRNFNFVLLYCILLLYTHKGMTQDICQELATLKKGTVIEYANYNKKDKYESGQVMTVNNQSVRNGGIYSEISSVLLDKKKKESMSFDLEMECRDNTFYIDLRNLLDPAVYQSMSAMEIEWSGAPNGYPGNMKTGDKLKDSQLVMDVRSGGTRIMGMTINIIDQEVVGKESVTTPAGTFECYKITSTTEIKSILNRSYTSAVWFSPVAGAVRTENYDKKGNLNSYTIIARLEPGS